MSALPFADSKPLTYRVNLAAPLDLKGYEAQDGYAALRQSMALGHREHRSADKHGVDQQVVERVVEPAAPSDDRDVDATGSHAAQLGHGTALAQSDHEVTVLVGEAREGSWHERRQGGRERSEYDPPGDPLPQSVELELRGGNSIKHRGDVDQQRRAARGRLHPAGLALEQDASGRLLHEADLPRDGRLCVAELTGGGRERASGRDGRKNAHPGQGHLRHGRQA